MTECMDLLYKCHLLISSTILVQISSYVQQKHLLKSVLVGDWCV